MDVDLRVVIALAALLLALVQYWTSHRRQIDQTTFQLLETFNREEVRLARFRFGDHLKEAAKSDDGFASLTDEKLSEISLVAATFGMAGTLGKRRKIDVDLFVEMWGDVAVTTWSRMEPYREYYTQKFGRPVGHWDYFKWLVSQADKRVQNS